MFPSSRISVLAGAITLLLATGTGAVLAEPDDPARTVVAMTAGPAAVVPAPTVPPVVAPGSQPEPVATTVAPQPPAPPAPTPRPEPAVEPAPVAAPPPAAPGPAPVSPQERAEAALAEAVPATWRDALPVSLRIIEGTSSYADGSGEIMVGRYHAEGRWSHLLSVISHEFGHIIAFAHGSGAFAGAAPEGWPDPHHGPSAEAWADCVAQAFTGIVDPSYGMPPCPQPTLDWTAAWLAAGPP
jgi:hypothetical protein